MKLAEARELNTHHPPGQERISLVEEQLASFRRDFYGHIQILERCEAWEEQGIEVVPGPPDPFGKPTQANVAEVKATSEQCLETLKTAIDKAMEEIHSVKGRLAAIDPNVS